MSRKVRTVIGSDISFNSIYVWLSKLYAEFDYWTVRLE